VDQGTDEVISESHAPTELVAIDPKVCFKHRQHTIGVAKNVKPPEQQLAETGHSSNQKNSVRNTTRMLPMTCAFTPSRTVRSKHQMPKKYKLVHSNGQVDVVTDNTNRNSSQKQSKDHRNYNRRQRADSENYLSASETEYDEPRIMSMSPVSKRQDDEIEELQQGSVVNTSDDEQVEELQQETEVNAGGGEQHVELQHESEVNANDDEQHTELQRGSAVNMSNDEQVNQSQQTSAVNASDDEEIEVLEYESEVNTSDDEQHEKLQQKSEVVACNGKQHLKLQQESEVSSESCTLTKLLTVDLDGTDKSHFQQQASGIYTRIHRKEMVDSVKLDANKLCNYRKQCTGYDGCSSESDSEMDEQRTWRGGSHFDRQTDDEFRRPMRPNMPNQTEYRQPSYRKMNILTVMVMLRGLVNVRKILL